MSDLNREVLTAVAGHGAVDERVVAARLAPVDREQIRQRLRALASGGWLTKARVLRAQSWCFWITEPGVQAIAHPLPAPIVTTRALRQDLAAGWAWMFASGGRFSDAEVLTERDMLVRDLPLLEKAAVLSDFAGPCGVRASGLVERDASGLHHPNVALLWPGSWTAMEVQLGWPDPRRLSSLLAGYGADPRWQRVVFLVGDARVAREVEAVISAAGLSQSACARLLPFEVRAG